MFFYICGKRKIEYLDYLQEMSTDDKWTKYQTTVITGRVQFLYTTKRTEERKTKNTVHDKFYEKHKPFYAL